MGEGIAAGLREVEIIAEPRRGEIRRAGQRNIDAEVARKPRSPGICCRADLRPVIHLQRSDHGFMLQEAIFVA
jgi:hypothetical protein